MNIIDTHKEGAVLTITVHGAFNLRIKNLIESRITTGVHNLYISLTNCRAIDSEGVVFLHRWQSSGKGLRIKDPPSLFFEVLEILELDSYWDLDNIIIQ